MGRKKPKSPKRALVARVEVGPSRPRQSLFRTVVLVLVVGVAAIFVAGYINPPLPTQTPERLAAGAAYFDSIAKPYRSAFNTMNLLNYPDGPHHQCSLREHQQQDPVG